MVYVISQDDKPLMPCSNPIARLLLKQGRAKIKKREPFTIKLTYDTTNYTQDLTLGVDTGSRTIGTAVSKDTGEIVYMSEVVVRNDIADKMAQRAKYRRNRRNRKTRYRKSRWLNRANSIKNGRFSPTMQSKLNSHVKEIEYIKSVLPIRKMVFETGQFNTHLMKNPILSNSKVKHWGYQKGTNYGFENTKAMVLNRDNYTCQCCKGKSKDKVLNVHHIESRKTGGNAPNNLITLCETCHKGYHNGTIVLPNAIKRGMRFRDAAFMNIMRWTLYENLKKIYNNVSLTYGYITKNIRINNGLSKSHYFDARCISGNPTAKPLGYYFYQRKVRCHNRKIHKCKINKGGIRKRNQAAFVVHGFRLYDKVRWDGHECFIFGRRSTGRMDLRLLDGTHINASVGFKNLKLLEKRNNYLTEVRKVS